jgi:hypothetical protein
MTTRSDVIDIPLADENFQPPETLINILRGQHGYKEKGELRKDLEQLGEVWDEKEFVHQFEETGRNNPIVAVVRKSDQKRGTLLFTEQPRLYFYFCEYPDNANGREKAL